MSERPYTGKPPESFGFEWILYQKEGPKATVTINRWWWPTLMMFGPPDRESSNTPVLMRWGIKTKMNDELRHTFVNRWVPDLHTLHLTVPVSWFSNIHQAIFAISN